jgi:hypothetical protein
MVQKSMNVTVAQQPEEGGHDEVDDVGGTIRNLLDMEHCGHRDGIIAS